MYKDFLLVVGNCKFEPYSKKIKLTTNIFIFKKSTSSGIIRLIEPSA